jgi:hypothetical protein
MTRPYKKEYKKRQYIGMKRLYSLVHHPYPWAFVAQSHYTRAFIAQTFITHGRSKYLKSSNLWLNKRKT